MLANPQRSYPLHPHQHSDHPSPSAPNVPFYFGSSFSTSTPSPSELGQTSSYMAAQSNPQVRIHQSSPAPPLSEGALSEHQWQYQNTASHMWPSSNTQYREGGNKHHRGSSGSSIGSGGPSSPFNQTTSHPVIAQEDSSAPGFSPYDFAEQADSFVKSYDDSQDSFLAPGFQSYDPTVQTSDSNIAAKLALMGVMKESRDDSSTFSGRRSASSRGAASSPKTPRSSIYEGESQTSTTSYDGLPLMSDNYGYVSAAPTSAGIRAPSQMLSPYNNTAVSERIRAANSGHLGSLSPASNSSRERSPYRHQGSPLAMSSDNFIKSEADAQIFRQQPYRTTSTPKTVSPKDITLEFNDSEADSSMPLFPAEDATASRRQNNYNAFVTPSLGPTITVPQQYPFIPQSRQQSFQSSRADSVPEFPAHLTSMESTASEGELMDVDVQRPAHAAADSGTYTCTYHGCTLRFETPAKLQKHKREGHRQSTPSQAATGMSSAALLRNSQAGPHRCDRTNPQTGKPCNTIFSRPYDLTRHEDTIHNARKQKVRCQFCTEEKTFSRNDALTRHMRVVHPEIDFPGKSRKRHD